MGIFGWSYPPHCESVPDDEDRGCEVCLQSEDACVCPPCDVCGEHGRGECYVDRSLEGLSFEGCHGMGLTPEQKEAMRRGQERMREKTSASQGATGLRPLTPRD